MLKSEQQFKKIRLQIEKVSGVYELSKNEKEYKKGLPNHWHIILTLL